MASIDVLATITAAVAQELTLGSVVKVALEQFVDALGARFAYVHRADERHRELSLLGYERLPARFVAPLSRLSYDAAMFASRAALARARQVVSTPGDLDPALARTRDLLAETGCETMVALPLLARERLVGVLTLGFLGSRDFGEDEWAALGMAADLLAVGILDAGVSREARRLRTLVDALTRTTAALASEIELRPVLQTLIDEARSAVGAEYGSIGIARSPHEPFNPWVFSGISREQAAAIERFPPPVATFGLASEGRAIRVSDIRKHPAFRGFPPHHPQMTSYLGVPLRHGGEWVGTLYVGNKRGAEEFTADDQRTIELLLGPAAAAIHHAALRREARDEAVRLTALVDNAPNAVLFVESGTERIRANRRAIELLGQGDMRTLGEYRGTLMTPDGEPLEHAAWPSRRVLRGEPFETQEMLLQKPDGTTTPILLSASRVPHPRDEGRLLGVVVAYEDISYLKEQQRQREEWAGLVAHELRQPLALITVYIGMLRRMIENPDPGRLREATLKMQRAATRLSGMIGDLADAASVEAGQVSLHTRPVELGVLARDVIEAQRALHGERVIRLRAHPSPEIEIDPSRVEQVISNLLGNAIKYSMPGSTIDVDVHVDEGEVHLVVTNRGRPIDPARREKIFDRYYRAPTARASSVAGLGLGLYIAKGIVEAHGGRIWVDSTDDETSFHVAFPAPVAAR